MDFSDFRSRAISEGRRYGKDEYVFVREFAQNARDAGAQRISLSADYSEGTLRIVFTDDGEGMAFSHARRYLFTLYASSKEKEASSAGQFGVGFWSILLFSPHSILIYSKTQKENWGVEFNQTLERERAVKSPLQHHGTQLVAYKTLHETKARKCIADLESSLRRYCRYLRRNNRAASPLAVFFNGKRIDGPMELEGECAATFSYRDVQGAVALGKSPQVSLHVRGLPVWSGTSLSELQYGATPEVPISYPSGLAPVYLLNGNRLSVTLDRRSVFDDAALHKTRRIANREMRRLVAQYLDKIAPPGLLARLEYFFSTFSEDFLYHFKRRVMPILPIIVVLMAVGMGVFYFFPEKFQTVYGSTVTEHVPGIPFLPTYRGGAAFSGEYERATTDTLSGDTLEMQYAPPHKSLYFRTQVVEQLDVSSGAKSGRLTPYRTPAEYKCSLNCIDVSLLLDSGAGVYHLPVPTGYYIDKDSIRLNVDIDGQLVRSSKDDWLFIQKETAGGQLPSIQYQAGPVVTSLTSPERFLDTPDVLLPPAYRKALQQSKKYKNSTQKVTFLTALVEHSISYDTSADTVAKYRNFFSEKEPGNWYDFVFAINRGDCDVKNIILINLLRRLGIPTRLAIGYVGKNGRPEQGKHAWVEYYHDGWSVADATGQGNAPGDAGDEMTNENAEDVELDGPRVQAPSGARSSLAPPRRSVKKTPFKVNVPERKQLAPVLMWVGIAAIVLTAGLLAVLIRRLLGATKITPSAEQETLAAKMLQAALENDKMNIRGSGLFSRALIPTWNGVRICMNQAVKLAKRQKLYYSNLPCGLVDSLVQRKCIVVKTENTMFSPVVARLAGSMNIQEIASLHPVQLSRENVETSPGHQVLKAAESICRTIGLPHNTIVPCRGLSGMLFREFDLTRIGVPWTTGIPNRFIAVQLDDDQVWHSLITLGGGIRGAAILVLDRIAAHSDMMFHIREQVRTALTQLEKNEDV